MEGGMDKLAIIGAGAWGTALAVTARRAGREVVLWAREAEVAQAINAGRENAAFLPGSSFRRASWPPPTWPTRPPPTRSSWSRRPSICARWPAGWPPIGVPVRPPSSAPRASRAEPWR